MIALALVIIIDKSEEIAMRTFSKLFITLKTQIDAVSDNFENHEALAKMAIKDVETVGIKTQQHLNQLKQLEQQTHQQIAGFHKEIENWSNRAIAVRIDDESLALECMKRVLASKKQLKNTEQHLHQTQATIHQVELDLSAMQLRLQQLHQKKNQLLARQTHAQTATVMQNNRYTDIDQDVFERWENQLAVDEFPHSIPQPVGDVLASKFEQQEEMLELKQMLANLGEG